MKVSAMELTKDKIRHWLTDKNKDREWLAKQCGVSKGTVDQWFAERGFSDSALATIALLMERDEQSGAPDETGLITFTTAEFERIERARLAVGNPSRPVFYRDAIIQYVDEIGEATEDGIALVAENPPATPGQGEAINRRVVYPAKRKEPKK
jgi:hypothetical protein